MKVILSNHNLDRILERLNMSLKEFADKYNTGWFDISPTRKYIVVNHGLYSLPLREHDDGYIATTILINNEYFQRKISAKHLPERHIIYVRYK